MSKIIGCFILAGILSTGGYVILTPVGDGSLKAQIGASLFTWIMLGVTFVAFFTKPRI